MSEEKKLTRSRDRMVGGVAAGLAQYLNIDPVLVRLAFVVLAIANGIGVLLYLVMWLVIPEDGTEPQAGEDVIRGNFEDMKQQVGRIGGRLRGSQQGEAILGVILVGAGILFLARMFVPAIPSGLFWPIVLIMVGVVLLLRR